MICFIDSFMKVYLLRSYLQSKYEKAAHRFGALLLASPARFERATFRLGGGYSIQLSYGDVKYGFILSDLDWAVKGKKYKKIG